MQTSLKASCITLITGHSNHGADNDSFQTVFGRCRIGWFGCRIQWFGCHNEWFGCRVVLQKNVSNSVVTFSQKIWKRRPILSPKRSVCINYINLSNFFLAHQPNAGHSRSFLRFLDHTQWHTTVGRTPLDKGSVRCRDLYLTTIHNTLKRQTAISPAGFESTNPSKGTAADPRLRRLGHWYRQF